MTDAFLTQLSRSCSTGYLDGEACLARCYVVLGEMLRYRGYDQVSFACANHASLVACMEVDGVVAFACSGPREDKAVVFQMDLRVGVKALRSIAESNSTDSISRIVVSIDGPTSFSRRDASACGIEFLTFRQIFNNIASHHLVPPHRRIACPDEQKAIARRYCIIAASQWPRFRLSDPMCVFGDFRTGDLIEIRRSCASGETPYYRLVC